MFFDDRARRVALYAMIIGGRNIKVEFKEELTGRVRWNKTIIENEFCEAGIEFFDTPAETMERMQKYISLKMENHKADPLKRLFDHP